MYDPSFLYVTAEGQTTHHHDHPEGSASHHDDRCIAPSRTFFHDWGGWNPFYGYGAAHHGHQTAHDDSCLMGNGCIGLGLSLDQAGKGMPTALLPASGLDLFGLDQATPRQDDPMATEFFQSQHPEVPRKAYKPDLDLLDAASASILSQASASQSPITRRQNDSSPDDAGTEADACSSCDSQCPGSDGACSAGSCAPCAPCGPCDELTMCRDENCDKDIIASDVAHSAIILHGMTGAARQQSTEHQHYDHTEFHQPMMDSHICFFNNQHAFPYTQDDNDMYQHCFHSQRVLEQFGQSYHTSQQGLTSRASAQVFPGGLNDHFSFAAHEHCLGGHLFSLDQAMGQVAQETQFQFGLPVNTQNYFTQTSDEAHPQQASTTNESSVTTPNLPPAIANGHTMSAAYVSNSVMDNTSAISPELSDTMMLETPKEAAYLPGPMIDAAASDDTCLPDNVHMHSDLQAQSVFKKEPALSGQCEEADRFPSPPSSDPDSSDTQVRNSTQRLGQKDRKDTKAHICQWTGANEGEVCGQQFANPKLLWDHVVEFHVDMLQKTQHGYICEWKGCDRRHRSDDTAKIGFHQKSKIKRHMETHTGSAQDYECPECGMFLSAQQALDNHLLRHGNLKPHKCTYPGCDYSCRSTTGLTTHIRSKHTKDRRFKCNKCGKSFSDSSNLSKHKRSHSNGRAYVCPKCGSGFNRRDGLCRHAKAVHDMTDGDLLVLCPPNPRGGRPKNSAH